MQILTIYMLIGFIYFAKVNKDKYIYILAVMVGRLNGLVVQSRRRRNSRRYSRLLLKNFRSVDVNRGRCYDGLRYMLTSRRRLSGRRRRRRRWRWWRSDCCIRRSTAEIVVYYCSQTRTSTMSRRRLGHYR